MAEDEAPPVEAAEAWEGACRDNKLRLPWPAQVGLESVGSCIRVGSLGDALIWKCFKLSVAAVEGNSVKACRPADPAIVLSLFRC